MQTIERLVDLCFRKDPNVLSVKTNILIDSLHDFVVPIDFAIENFDGRYCGPSCNMTPNFPKFKFDELKEEEEET